MCAQHTAAGTAEVVAVAATALTEPPTSDKEGLAFNRIAQVNLETTAFDHTTAPFSGDIFGVDSDSFLCVNRYVSAIVDLLEDKCISWGDYDEGLPYTGFNGLNYTNPVEGDYSRKRNLLQRYEPRRSKRPSTASPRSRTWDAGANAGEFVGGKTADQAMFEDHLELQPYQNWEKQKELTMGGSSGHRGFFSTLAPYAHVR